MNLPPWLLQRLQRQGKQPPTPFMGSPDYSAQAMDYQAPLSSGFQPTQGPQEMPMNIGGRYGTPAAPQGPGLFQPGPTGPMSEAAMPSATPSAGPGWAGMAQMAGGLLSEQQASQEAPAPQWAPQQATPMGEPMMSPYDLARMRRY